MKKNNYIGWLKLSTLFLVTCFLIGHGSIDLTKVGVNVPSYKKNAPQLVIATIDEIDTEKDIAQAIATKQLGHLKVTNTSLTNLDFLKNISGKTPSLEIANNPNLEHIISSGTLSASNISTLSISNNPKLHDLSGLDNLTVGHKIEITNNANLSTLAHIRSNSNYQTIITVIGNPNLRDLKAISSIKDVKSINLQGNHLENLQELSALRNVNESLQIVDESFLTSLSDLQTLSHVDSIKLAGLPGLLNLQGLSNLSQILRLTISNNKNLQSLNGLRIPFSMSDIEISSNPALQDLGNLSDLLTLFKLKINDNPKLVNLAGLNKLGKLTILEITDNQRLSSLQLSKLNTLGGNMVFFQIENNPTLCTSEAEQLLEKLIQKMQSFEQTQFTQNKHKITDNKAC